MLPDAASVLRLHADRGSDLRPLLRFESPLSLSSVMGSFGYRRSPDRIAPAQLNAAVTYAACGEQFAQVLACGARHTRPLRATRHFPKASATDLSRKTVGSRLERGAASAPAVPVPVDPSSALRATPWLGLLRAAPNDYQVRAIPEHSMKTLQPGQVFWRCLKAVEVFDRAICVLRARRISQMGRGTCLNA